VKSFCYSASLWPFAQASLNLYEGGSPFMGFQGGRGAPRSAGLAFSASSSAPGGGSSPHAGRLSSPRLGGGGGGGGGGGPKPSPAERFRHAASSFPVRVEFPSVWPGAVWALTASAHRAPLSLSSSVAASASPLHPLHVSPALKLADSHVTAAAAGIADGLDRLLAASEGAIEVSDGLRVVPDYEVSGLKNIS
jgi:hypothetical protein